MSNVHLSMALCLLFEELVYVEDNLKKHWGGCIGIINPEGDDDTQGVNREAWETFHILWKKEVMHVMYGTRNLLLLSN